MLTNSDILKNTMLKSSTDLTTAISLGTDFALDPNKNILYYIKDGKLITLINSNGLINDNSNIVKEIKYLSLSSLDDALNTESFKASEVETQVMLSFFRNFNICRTKIDKDKLKKYFDKLAFTVNKNDNEEILEDFIDKNIADFNNTEYFGNLLLYFESRAETDIFDIENYPERYSYDLPVYCFYPKLAYLPDDIGFNSMKEIIQDSELNLSKLEGIDFKAFGNTYIQSLSKELFSYVSPNDFSNNRRAPSNSFFVINSNDRLLGTESNDFILALLNNSLNKFNSVDMLDKFMKLFAQKTVEIIKNVQAEYKKECKEQLNKSLNYVKLSVLDIISLGLSTKVYATKLSAALLKLVNDAILYDKSFKIGLDDLSIYYGVYNTYEVFKTLCESDEFLVDTLEKEKFIEFVAILSQFFNDSDTATKLRDKLEPTFDCVVPMRNAYNLLFELVKDNQKYNIIFRDVKEG